MKKVCLCFENVQTYIYELKPLPGHVSVLQDLINLNIQEAILINCSRGPVVDEEALVEHLKQNPMFRVGLDVFEDEPYMKPGLADMPNAIVVPHIASASKVRTKFFILHIDI